MPLTSAIQGAMAIRREREKREHRRMSEIRRKSGQSGHSTSLSQEEEGERGQEEELIDAPPAKSESSITTFHMGIVFILLGFLMIFSSMIPSSFLSKDWSGLLGVGVSFIFIGLIMVMVNRIITAREEEELSRYVKQRLSRTKSGHALVKDSEGGGHHLRPPPLPQSAMKGHGGAHSPRSPKDKVTFAEFNEVKGLEGRAKGGSIQNGVSHGGGGGVGGHRIIGDIPKVLILEPSSESQKTESGEEKCDLNGTLESVTSVENSPSTESQCLLSAGQGSTKRKKKY